MPRGYTGADEALLAWVAERAGATRATRESRLQSLWRGYGELFRVRLEGAASASAIVKVVAPPPGPDARDAAETRSHQRKLRSYAVEQRWYSGWAAQCPEACRVARCYGTGTRPDGDLLVLEDLDAAGYPRRPSVPGPAELRAALAWLAAFHARFMGVSPDGLWPEGSYWHLATRPDELERTGHRGLHDAAAHLDRRLSAARFRTLVHGDAKLENLCFSEDGQRVAAVDFQYVGGGCGMRDVAYLLVSCLAESACARQAPALLDHYFSVLRDALSGTCAAEGAQLEAEWRDLYPVAWADFARFLSGWERGHGALHPYTASQLQQALR